MKWLSPVLALLLAAGSVSAEGPELPVKRLTLHPAAAPSPALKYALLPELRDESPGNAALGYYRAFSPEWTPLWRKPELQERAEKWAVMPLPELRRQDATWLTRNAVLRELDQAARREDCN